MLATTMTGAGIRSRGRNPAQPKNGLQRNPSDALAS
jgi:hypothetical protein